MGLVDALVASAILGFGLVPILGLAQSRSRDTLDLETYYFVSSLCLDRLQRACWEEERRPRPDPALATGSSGGGSRSEVLTVDAEDLPPCLAESGLELTLEHEPLDLAGSTRSPRTAEDVVFVRVRARWHRRKRDHEHQFARMVFVPS